MKTKAQKEITIAEIKEIIDENTLSEARKSLSGNLGSRLEVSGKILKVIKRNGEFKLYLQTDSLKVFAEFENGFPEKFKKNRVLNLSGKLSSFGTTTVCLTQCGLLKTGMTSLKGDINNAE